MLSITENKIYKEDFKVKDNLFQQAKNAFMNLANMETNVNEKDFEAIKQIIQDAYEDASPEEKKELEQMEKQLSDDGHLH